MRISLRNNISPQIMRLQAFLKASAAPNRDVVELPPFTAFFHPSERLKYFSYAIPEGDVEPTESDIVRLRAAFSARPRLPRLEWIEEAAPSVAGALARAGMREELRTPLMSCGPDAIAEPTVDGATVAAASDDDLRELANIQRSAFGHEPLRHDEAPQRPSGGAVLARIGSEAVSAAAWTNVVDGHSEIVGVATAEPWRGKGLAGLVTAAASRAAFEAGASICVLSPGDEAAQRVYSRAGFLRVATMLHYSDPD
jgi:RimJ/RimL family protein N-acetyltransferase